MHSYDSVESLIDGERESNIHVECSRPVTMRALDTVRGLFRPALRLLSALRSRVRP